MATLRCELELHARNGLYYAVGFVLLVTLAVLAALPTAGLERLLPAVAFNNLALTAFFFAAALTLLETNEGSALARLVTPLRQRELLVARMIALALLGAVHHLALGLVLLAPGPSLVLLALGVGLAGALMALLGHYLAAGQRELSAFLWPALPWLALLMLPMIADVLAWQHPILWLHPLYAALTIIRAAVVPVAWWELALGLSLALGWLGGALWVLPNSIADSR
ncbi:hypothetical protein CJ255_09810 [Candidatus Viridilinea mediisalina]|uniref:ABC transporter permease n=2 Tax=Candidatus Viridilinea mediisalina TaxID=2024553 RepID=A0A2A6RK70_9CHLR|nr:hypothetical protein CJ255_09810 [Candidatus Viridilinea mediisalina]